MIDSIRLLIVDDHLIRRQCLEMALLCTGRFAAIELLDNAEEAIKRVGQLHPGVVLVEWDLPNKTALEVTRQIACDCPTTKVIILSMDEIPESIRECAESGAAGYILRSEGVEQLKTRIEQALRGELLCSPQAARVVFARLTELAQERRSGRSCHDTITLTSREMQIIAFIADGLSNKQIAKGLCLSVHTVKNHVHNLLEKLSVNGRYAAVKIAREKKWLNR